MSQLKKCLYIIDLLRRRGPITLSEMNNSFRYSPLYDKNIEPLTFAMYKDFIAFNFPYYIEFNNKQVKLGYVDKKTISITKKVVIKDATVNISLIR